MKKNILLSLFLSISISVIFAQNVVSVEFLEHRPKAELLDEFGPFISYGADLYRVLYETPDIHGVTDTASGLFLYPVAEFNDRIFPSLIYQHGTVGSRWDVPSELQGGYQLALFWAGVGYATTAADFLGLGESRGFHPYVHSETEASAAIDLHLAVRDYALDNQLYINEQLFVTGYSQGGHAAAAAQKKIQEDYAGQLEVTASAPMSGPYNISGVMRDLMLGDDEYLFVGYAPYSALSYNLEYNFFDHPNELFKEPAATWIQEYYNEEINLWTLNIQLISWLSTNYGGSIPKYMFLDSMINVIETDPDHPINQALRDNDLINWAPAAPTRLYYCMADDQVPFMNSVVAQDTMIAAGATDLEAIDVNSGADHGGCVNPAINSAYIFFIQHQNIGYVDPESTIELDQNIKFRITPNPASDQVTISFDNDLPDFERIEITSLEGKLLRSSSDQLTIRTNSLARGMYIVKVISEKGIWVEKLIVEK